MLNIKQTAIVGLLAILAIGIGTWSSEASAATCARTARPILSPPMIVKQQRASRNQRKNITTALNVANRMRAPRSHRVALVAAIIVENSGWNKPWGHGTSVGILQLIDVHGTLAWRMKIKNSAGWFLRGARKLDPRGTARLATNKYSWGLVQRVQRSGVPFAYNERLPEARRIVANWYKTCPS